MLHKNTHFLFDFNDYINTTFYTTNIPDNNLSTSKKEIYSNRVKDQSWLLLLITNS